MPLGISPETSPSTPPITKTCFVIAPIGKDGSETRKRSDKVLRHIIRPVARNLGLVAVRADEIAASGVITNQVIQKLIDSDIVVADLTENNPNVFYELAIRHALRRPFVHIIEAGHPIPFDVAANRAIVFDHTDLDSVANAIEGLERQMRAALEPGTEIQSPFSVAIDLDALKVSGDPEKRGIADLMGMVAGLTRSVASLEKTLHNNRRRGRGWRPPALTNKIAENSSISVPTGPSRTNGDPGYVYTCAKCGAGGVADDLPINCYKCGAPIDPGMIS
jgi:hypothetical protein